MSGACAGSMRNVPLKINAPAFQCSNVVSSFTLACRSFNCAFNTRPMLPQGSHLRRLKNVGRNQSAQFVGCARDSTRGKAV